MNNNKLLIAAAGSGKTTFLVKKALNISSENVLITTYTEANKKEIRKKIIREKGYIPSNIKILTWFTFLLQHGVRPYQSILNEDLHETDIGFYLTDKKSGHRYETVYWGEKDFMEYYFTETMKIYSDKISKFIFKCNEKSNGLVINRIASIFDHIYIDEIQDLAGYDLELLKLFFKTPKSVLLVGDPRQVTYLTHPTKKYQKYSRGKIKDFINSELGKNVTCEIDETTLNISYRNNQSICEFSGRLYPDYPIPKASTSDSCNSLSSGHEGIFIIRRQDIESYLEQYQSVQLRWNSSEKCKNGYPVMNFGESKGRTFDRVLIYPTDAMKKWIKNNSVELKNETRAKLYVGITRAKYSVGIVMDCDNKNEINGLSVYQAEDYTHVPHTLADAVSTLTAMSISE